MSSNYGPRLIDDGLILYWDVLNPDSYIGDGSILKDLSGNGYDATLGDYTYTDGHLTGNENDYSWMYTTVGHHESWTLNWLMKTAIEDIGDDQSIISVNPLEEGTDEGEFSITLGLFFFTCSNMVNFDENHNIFISGSFGGFDDHISGYMFKLDSSGKVDESFTSDIEVGSGIYTIKQLAIHDGSARMFGIGTNIGYLGVREVDMETGETLEDPPTGGGVIGGGKLIIDESTNKMWILGTSNTYGDYTISHLTKVNLDNEYTIDTTFDTSTGLSGDDIEDAILDASKNIYIVGDFTEYQGVARNRIAKINGETGTLDTEFDPGDGFNGIAYCIKQFSDGKLLVGGNFTTYDSSEADFIIKLNPNGTIDEEFHQNSGDGEAFNSYVFSIDIQDDQKILVVGNFLNYDGSTARYIIRLNEDGTIDDEFYGNMYGEERIGMNYQTSSITVQPWDQKIIVIGPRIRNYGDASIFRAITRLNTDGTIDDTFDVSYGFNIGIYRENNYRDVEGGTAQWGMGGFGDNGGARALLSEHLKAFTNEWEYLTMSFDGTSSIKYYVNGEARDTQSTSNNSFDFSLTSMLVYPYFSSFSAYNRVLSDAEVLQNYEALRTRFGINM